MTSYKRIGTVTKTGEILRYLAGQKEPVSAPQVAGAVGLPTPTVMCHLVTQEDLGWVQQINGFWKLGMGLALIYARVKSNLEADHERVGSQIRSLETGGE